MLNEICAEIRNYFSLDEDKIFGEFAVVNREITPPVELEDGQYYRIVGSVFNDGVHKKGDTLTNEPTFKGAVWKMRVPYDVLNLADEIEQWQLKNGSPESANMSPYSSESFGGYSYTKASGFGSDNGSPYATWQTMFAKRLNPYRKVRAV